MLPDLSLREASGGLRPLRSLAGHVLLVVNVASRCHYTSQYAALEELHREHFGRGLRVMGFPCNDFQQQEPGSLPEILQFCRDNFGASFPIFEKVTVQPPHAHPLFAWLMSEESPEPGPVRWNFEKWLIGRDGKIVARFRSQVTPKSHEVLITLQKALERHEADAPV